MYKDDYARRREDHDLVDCGGGSCPKIGHNITTLPDNSSGLLGYFAHAKLSKCDSMFLVLLAYSSIGKLSYGVVL